MINMAWATLFHADSLQQGDWLRVCPPTGPVVKRTVGLAETLFPQKDPHIRGWLVEAAIQLALASTYRDEILKLDPYNNYATPVSGKHAELSIGEGWVVVANSVNRLIPRYNQVASVSLNPTTGALSVLGADEKEINGAATKSGRTFSNIPFTSTSSAKVTLPMDQSGLVSDPDNEGRIIFRIHGKVLPEGRAFSYILNGLKELSLKGLLTEGGTPFDVVGRIVLHILKGA